MDIATAFFATTVVTAAGAFPAWGGQPVAESYETAACQPGAGLCWSSGTLRYGLVEADVGRWVSLRLALPYEAGLAPAPRVDTHVRAENRSQCLSGALKRAYERNLPGVLYAGACLEDGRLIYWREGCRPEIAPINARGRPCLQYARIEP